VTRFPITMTILITGANKGIGFQNARIFAKNNYSKDIIITSRNLENGQYHSNN